MSNEISVIQIYNELKLLYKNATIAGGNNVCIECDEFRILVNSSSLYLSPKSGSDGINVIFQEYHDLNFIIATTITAYNVANQIVVNSLRGKAIVI